MGFASHTFFRGQKEILCHLLSDGAAALSVSSGKNIGNHSPGKGDDVKAKMAVKTTVFGINNGINHILWEFLGTDNFRINRAKSLHLIAIVGNDSCKRLPGAIDSLAHVWQSNQTISNIG